MTKALYVNGMVQRDRDTDTDGIVDERHYYQQDGNFNVTALIDISGDVVERVVNDAYGAPTFLDPNWSTPSNQSSFGNDVVFQGGRRDPTTGFINFQHRDYSTTLGRPIQVDWIRYEESMSLYQWEMSNPVRWLDPTGLGAVAPPSGPQSPPMRWPLGPLFTLPGNPFPQPRPVPGDVNGDGVADIHDLIPPRPDGPSIGPQTRPVVVKCARDALSLGPNMGKAGAWLGLGHDYLIIIYPNGTMHSGGMGRQGGGLRVGVRPHDYDTPTSQEALPDVDPAVARAELRHRKPLGRFCPGINDCRTFVRDVCRKASPPAMP